MLPEYTISSSVSYDSKSTPSSSSMSDEERPETNETGKKRKKTSESSVSSMKDDPVGKKEKRKERNRQLAAESRERKKHLMEELMRENCELKAKLAKYEALYGPLPANTTEEVIGGDTMVLPMYHNQAGRRKTQKSTETKVQTNTDEIAKPPSKKRRAISTSSKILGTATLGLTALIVYIDPSDENTTGGSRFAPVAAFWTIMSGFTGEDFILSLLCSVLLLCLMIVMQYFQFLGTFPSSLFTTPSKQSSSVSFSKFVQFRQSSSESEKEKKKTVTISM